MKFKASILTLVLCLALALGLAGCQEDTATTGDDQTTTSAKTETTATTAQTPAPTEASPLPQGVQDATGDARDLDGGSAEGSFAALGDIESASLEVQADALVFHVQTVDGLPAVLPEGVDTLTFVLEIQIDEDTGYLLALAQAVDFSSAWLASVTDFASGATAILEAGPTVAGDALRCAVPLAAMPDFTPSFKWRLDSNWSTGTITLADALPDTGDDPFHPTLLDFPY